MFLPSFHSRWLEKFALPETGWLKIIDEQLHERAFCDHKEAKDLLSFVFKELTDILQQDNCAETKEMAEACAWTCFAFWQCGSAFPSFPENYADCLRKALRQTPGKRPVVAKMIARLIVSEKGISDGQCGFNQLSLRQPELVRDSERLIHEGRYEDYLNAHEKYEEFELYLKKSAEFQADWQQIKASFPKQFRAKTTIRRTLIPERNWVTGPGAQFEKSFDSFQAVFDLFCWKYYLWAMDGDTPQLLKASVVFTPLGTQIFIPGYLSFDPKRDLNFGKIAKLHRARGVTRQGKGFSVGRKENAVLSKKAKSADKEAKKRGLTGDRRYEFICQQIGFHDEPDYRRTRKLLE